MTSHIQKPSQAKGQLNYQHSIGKNDISTTPETPFKIEEHPEFTFNTPVGLCTDQYKRTWVADTGNNRIVIINQNLTKVMKIHGVAGSDEGQFNMPFRLLHHPNKPWIYVSDLANRRIHLLQYNRQLLIKTLALFGNAGPMNEQLQGPNGLAFCDGKLCVADEFYVNSKGGGRVAIFSETGDFINDIQKITGSTDPGLLWPQGISSDEKGRLYIANTGFYNVVRCDLSGKGIPFSATGRVEIEGLELSRDVAVINDIVYVPGGSANRINRYTLDGEAQPPLAGFFSPIQIIPHPKSKQHILVSEPILAHINLYLLDSNPLIDDINLIEGAAIMLPQRSVGNARDNPGELYFVTSAITETVRSTRPPGPPKKPQEGRYQFPEKFNPFNPHDWMTETFKLWSDGWQYAMNESFKFWFPQGPRPKNRREDAWLLNSANRQITRSELSVKAAQSTEESLFPLIPGALGIDAFHPTIEIPGQVAPGTALFLVTNYLSGMVSVLQYNPYIDDLVHFAFFGGYGSAPWELKNPQGIAVNDATGDIYIADTGNHRISHWRLSASGIIGFVDTFGSLGDGDGEFFGPSDVTIDDNGNLYIADQTNNRIQVLDQNGGYQYQFGQQGYGKDNDNFLLPTSILAAEQKLFINDLVNRSLKVFTLEGEFITAYSGLGAEPETGQLWMPYLLHGNDQRLIVPDCATNQAHLYHFSTTEQHIQQSAEQRDRHQSFAILEAATHKHLRSAMGLNANNARVPPEQNNEALSDLFCQATHGSIVEAADALNKLKSTHDQLQMKRPPPTRP